MLTVSDLKILCEKYGFTPGRDFGQNFLLAEWPINQIVQAAELKKTDQIIEIGPGFGQLTFALAPLARQVTGIEIEKKISEYWTESSPENVKIIWGNAIRIFDQVAAGLKKYKVAANLPYQITGRILRVILSSPNPPEVSVLMVQKEVAEKICAKPGRMSMLSISVLFYGMPEIVDFVPASVFWPQPKVDSAILKITKRKKSLTEKIDPDRFFKIVKAGFSSPRKQLRKNLSIGLNMEKGMIESAIAKSGAPQDVRAEVLSLEQWLEIFGALSADLK